jgi:hypothetical protein
MAHPHDLIDQGGEAGEKEEAADEGGEGTGIAGRRH